MFFTRTIASLSIVLALTACTKRSEVETKLKYAEPTVVFSEAKTEYIEQLIYADKRSFNDYDCDGITDMAAMVDKNGILKPQKFMADFYKGYYDKEGLVNFKYTESEFKIPFKVDKWVDQFKLDSVSLNNDGCSDIVYTAFSDSSNGKFKMKFAINDNDLEITDKNKFIPIEKIFTNKEYYDTGIGRIENIFIEFIHTMQDDYSYNDEDYDIYHYLKQDWCDFNNDGLDDFILIWKADSNLSALIAYSEKYGDTGYNQFSHTESFFIPMFLKSREAGQIDTEDFNGDGFCDILSYNRTSSFIDVSLLRNDNKKFIPEKTQRLILPEGLDWFSEARKLDTFQRNKDNKADINYFTELDDKQVLITFFAN
jgi:hypothetical protein